MKERSLQQKILAYLAKQNIFHFKLVQANYNGLPDLFIFSNGKVLAIELKKPGGRLSSLQRIRLQRLQQAGVAVHIINSYDTFLNVLNKFILSP